MFVRSQTPFLGRPGGELRIAGTYLGAGKQGVPTCEKADSEISADLRDGKIALT